MVGRPNVGKSSLVNTIVGGKVSIVTERPQTTRSRIAGIRTGPGYQLVLVDTPGFHKPRTGFGRRMNRVVEESTEGIDAVLLVVDGAAGVGRGDAFAARAHVARFRGPRVCAVNKIDRLPRAGIPPQLEAAAALAPFDHVVPVSARTGAGVEELRGVLVGLLPEGPPLYPAGEITDQRIEFRIAEAIREKALVATREEVPHSIAVEVTSVERDGQAVRVEAEILVERESHKGIVIGRAGDLVKRIGTEARPDIERLLDARVFLALRVKVARAWQRDPAALARLGY